MDKKDEMVLQYNSFLYLDLFLQIVLYGFFLNCNCILRQAGSFFIISIDKWICQVR